MFLSHRLSLATVVFELVATPLSEKECVELHKFEHEYNICNLSIPSATSLKSQITAQSKAKRYCDFGASTLKHQLNCS